MYVYKSSLNISKNQSHPINSPAKKGAPVQDPPWQAAEWWLAPVNLTLQGIKPTKLAANRPVCKMWDERVLQY